MTLDPLFDRERPSKAESAAFASSDGRTLDEAALVDGVPDRLVERMRCWPMIATGDLDANRPGTPRPCLDSLHQHPADAGSLRGLADGECGDANEVTADVEERQAVSAGHAEHPAATIFGDEYPVVGAGGEIPQTFDHQLLSCVVSKLRQA
ncbi:hypothetical protein ATSB10_36900 [Dyella thiooxydans]|uniref:Uncharacterized protein n=1 Tax=Dyella thiooxydans TaxID=445710 RepID=A0A160N5Q7_9GAMM|nr:hypothetical protein ATSB10_36900 [Dyella thiooxydans]